MAQMPSFSAALKRVPRAVIGEAESTGDTASADAAPLVPPRNIDVTLEDFRVWPGQPRRAPNPRYDSLRESIARIGLERPIDLTQMPGEDGYVTRRGGGTRIAILWELWRKEKDERFFRHTFPLHPWPGVVAQRISHAIENLERGEQTWGDTTRAALDLCGDMAKLSDDFADLSLRNKAERISSAGWPMRHGRLGLYLYTAERLLPHLPQAFDAGMGRPRVEVLRTLDLELHKLVKEADAARVDEYEALFIDVIKRHDDQDLDLGRIEQSLREDVLRRFGVQAREASAPDLLTEPPAGGASDAGEPARPEKPTARTADEETAPSGSETSAADDKATQAGIGTATSAAAPARGSASTHPSLDAKPVRESTVTAVRSAASTLALDLATRYGMVHGALYALTDPPVGLSYGVDSPDAVRLHESDNWGDALLAHSVMHFCMWSSVLVDVELGFAAAKLLEELQDSSPEKVGLSDGLEAPRATHVALRRQLLRSRRAAGLTNDPENQLLGDLDRLEHLATRYAELRGEEARRARAD